MTGKKRPHEPIISALGAGRLQAICMHCQQHVIMHTHTYEELTTYMNTTHCPGRTP